MELERLLGPRLLALFLGGCLLFGYPILGLFSRRVSDGGVSLLFAVAWFGDRRAERWRSLVANPWVYALSMTVYCMAWTFYGSVGRATTTGIGFLPI